MASNAGDEGHWRVRLQGSGGRGGLQRPRESNPRGKQQNNIGVWENTGIVDIGVKELGLTDPRPWMFNMSKKGKKWLGQSGWKAALEYLNGLPADVQRSLKIPNAVDPYGGSR